LQILAYSTIELCGLIYLYQQKGEEWGVSDEKIKAFIQMEGPTNTGTIELK
jgi:hypothetical protein